MTVWRDWLLSLYVQGVIAHELNFGWYSFLMPCSRIEILRCCWISYTLLDSLSLFADFQFRSFRRSAHNREQSRISSAIWWKNILVSIFPWKTWISARREYAKVPGFLVIFVLWERVEWLFAILYLRTFDYVELNTIGAPSCALTFQRARSRRGSNLVTNMGEEGVQALLKSQMR
jgi:hypothetical protein